MDKAFLSYYQQLLGTNHAHRKKVMQQINKSGPLITDEHRLFMNSPYTAEEVKQALFSIPGNKAPRPDGFGAQFYKDNWEIVGTDVTAVVLGFFAHKKLLKELNSIVITLIRKSKCPTTISDSRPISCVMYYINALPSLFVAD